MDDYAAPSSTFGSLRYPFLFHFLLHPPSIQERHRLAGRSVIVWRDFDAGARGAGVDDLVVADIHGYVVDVIPAGVE